MNFFLRLFYNEKSVKARLKKIINSVPENQKTQRQYINAVEFLEYNEFGLSADSLMELTFESEHCFSEEFWKELSEIFNLLKMKSEQGYCESQIKH